MNAETQTPSETLIKGILQYAAGFLEGYIQTEVKRIVTEALETRNTLELFNDDFDTRVRAIVEEMVDTALDNHTGAYCHYDDDDIQDTARSVAESVMDDIDVSERVSDAVSDAVSEQDLVDESRAEEIAQEAVDNIDWEQQVRQALSNIIKEQANGNITQD